MEDLVGPWCLEGVLVLISGSSHLGIVFIHFELLTVKIAILSLVIYFHYHQLRLDRLNLPEPLLLGLSLHLWRLCELLHLY